MCFYPCSSVFIRGSIELSELESASMLTRRRANRIVRSVILAFRHLVLALALLSLVAAQAPFVACSPATCATNIECASAQCCCNCGGQMACCQVPAKSHSDQSSATCSNPRCPMIAAAAGVTISQPSQLAVAPLAVCKIDSLSSAASCRRLVTATLTPPALPSPTLLALGCALTV